MKSNSFRCILSLNILELTGAELGELKKKNLKLDHAFKFLPTYCLTKENKISDTQCYLQFIDSGKEKFYLFDVSFAEEPLKEELSNMGIDFIFKDDDFGFIKHLKLNSYRDLNNSLPMSSHLIVEVKYVESGSYEYPEVDCEFSILGCLDVNKKFVEFA